MAFEIFMEFNFSNLGCNHKHNLPKISCREISENKVTFSKKLKIHPKSLKKLRKEEPETNVYKMLLSCFDKFPGYFEC